MAKPKEAILQPMNMSTPTGNSKNRTGKKAIQISQELLRPLVSQQSHTVVDDDFDDVGCHASWIRVLTVGAPRGHHSSRNAAAATAGSDWAPPRVVCTVMRFESLRTGIWREGTTYSEQIFARATSDRNINMTDQPKPSSEAAAHNSESDIASGIRNIDRVQPKLRAIKKAVSELECELQTNKSPGDDPEFDDYAWFQSWAQFSKDSSHRPAF